MSQARNLTAPTPRTNWTGVAYGVLLGVLAAYQQFKLPPALPLLFEQYGYGRVLAGGFMSVYALAGLALSIPAGRVLARRGPRPLLLAAFALFLAGNGLALAAPQHGPVLLLSRLLEGLGFAAAAVVGAVVATASASPAHRPVAVALWASWIPGGQIAGTLLAIPLVSAGLWRPLWWAAAGATLAVAAWGHRLFATGHAALATPVPAPAEPAPGGRGRPGLAMAVAAGVFCLWSTQYFAYMTWLPQYLVEARGLAPARAAQVYLLPPLLVIVFSLVAAALLRRGVGLAALLGGSVLVQAAAWFLAPAARGVWGGLASLLAYGAAAGLTPAALFALPHALPGTGGAAAGFATLMTGRNLGVLVGPVLLAQVVGWAGAGARWGICSGRSAWSPPGPAPGSGPGLRAALDGPAVNWVSITSGLDRFHPTRSLHGCHELRQQARQGPAAHESGPGPGQEPRGGCPGAEGGPA